MFRYCSWTLQQRWMVLIWAVFNLVVLLVIVESVRVDSWTAFLDLAVIEVLALVAPAITVCLIIVAHEVDRHSGRGISSLVRNARSGHAWNWDGSGKANRVNLWLDNSDRVISGTITKLSILAATATLALSEVADRLDDLGADEGEEAIFFFSRRQEMIEILGTYGWWSFLMAGIALLLAVMLMAVALVCYDAALRFACGHISDSMSRKGWAMESFAFYLLAWGVAALVGAFSPFACLAANAVFGSLLLVYFYPHHKLIRQLERESDDGTHCGHTGLKLYVPPS